MCASISVNECMNVRTRVYVKVRVYVSARVCVSVCVCKCTCMNVFMCECTCMVVCVKGRDDGLERKPTEINFTFYHLLKKNYSCD